MKPIFFELVCRVCYTFGVFLALSLVLYLSLGVQYEYFYAQVLNTSQACSFCFESSLWQWQSHVVGPSNLGWWDTPELEVDKHPNQMLHHQSQSWYALSLSTLGYFYPHISITSYYGPGFNLCMHLFGFGLGQAYAFWLPSMLMKTRVEAWFWYHVYGLGFVLSLHCAHACHGLVNELAIETLDSELFKTNGP
jgi:hypothetical protein